MESRHRHHGVGGGQRVEPFGGNDGVLAERSLAAAVPEAVAPDPLAGGEPAAFLRCRGHGSHQVTTDDERVRHRHRVTARADVGVDLVDGHRIHLDQYVRRSRRRYGKLPDADCFRRPRFGDESGTHIEVKYEYGKLWPDGPGR